MHKHLMNKKKPAVFISVWGSLSYIFKKDLFAKIGLGFKTRFTLSQI